MSFNTIKQQIEMIIMKNRLLYSLLLVSIIHLVLFYFNFTAYTGDYFEEEKYGFCIHCNGSAMCGTCKCARTLSHWIVKWWRLSLLHTLWYSHVGWFLKSSTGNVSQYITHRRWQTIHFVVPWFQAVTLAVRIDVEFLMWHSRVSLVLTSTWRRPPFKAQMAVHLMSYPGGIMYRLSVLLHCCIHLPCRGAAQGRRWKVSGSVVG